MLFTIDYEWDHERNIRVEVRRMLLMEPRVQKTFGLHCKEMIQSRKPERNSVISCGGIGARDSLGTVHPKLYGGGD